MVGEWGVMYVNQWKGWRMSCDIGEATENELWFRWIDGRNWRMRLFYVTAHSPILLSLHLHTAHSPTILSLHLRHLANHLWRGGQCQVGECLLGWFTVEIFCLSYRHGSWEGPVKTPKMTANTGSSEVTSGLTIQQWIIVCFQRTTKSQKDRFKLKMTTWQR